MKFGLPLAVLGILGIVLGGAMYAYRYHRTIGTGGIILGVILLVVGIAWWMMKDKKVPTGPTSQAPQAAKT